MIILRENDDVHSKIVLNDIILEQVSCLHTFFLKDNCINKKT